MTKPTKPFTPICEPAVLDRPNMAHFIGVSITPEISRRRSALIDLLYDTRKNT